MPTDDAAFQWETEALRDSPRLAPESPAPRPSTPPEQPPTPPEPTPAAAATPPPPPAGTSGWLTLREAHDATGIPIETLRKWGRRGSVPSVVEETDVGKRRLVDPAAVVARAERLGREIGPAATPEPAAAAAPPPTPAPAEPRRPSDGAMRDEAPEEPEAAPPGTMIVPIDAWDKMLAQLGNLHEAGQQLAEARERAAKAETEARFLRERLAELRTESTETDAPQLVAAPEPEPPTGPPPAAAPTPDVAVPGARTDLPSLRDYATRRWKAWRRR